MKTLVKITGIYAIILVFGLAVIGCDDRPYDEALNGTWISSETELGIQGEMKLNNGNFENTLFNSTTNVRLPETKGTYTTDDGKITLKITHVYGGGLTAGIGINLQMAIYFSDFVPLEEEWYTKAQIKAKIDAATASVLFPEGKSLAIEALDELFQASTSTYSLKGKTLTLTDEDGDISIFTRK